MYNIRRAGVGICGDGTKIAPYDEVRGERIWKKTLHMQKKCAIMIRYVFPNKKVAQTTKGDCYESIGFGGQLSADCSAGVAQKARHRNGAGG